MDADEIILVVTAVMILFAIVIELKVLCARIRALREDVRVSREVIELLQKQLHTNFNSKDDTN